MPSRRDFLRCTSAGLLATLFPVRHSLATQATDRRFLFVFATGGWDVTKVFATEFSNPLVDMEATAQPGQVGNLSFVDHADRPAVRRFFERYKDRCLLVNGIQVPSVAHESCRRLMMTGLSGDGNSDWPALVAAANSDRFPLPHLVLDGPAFPGALGQYVTRTGSGGQLGALLDGSILEGLDTPVRLADYRAEALMDTYVGKRVAAERLNADASWDGALQPFELALERARGMKARKDDVDWSAGSFGDQAALARSVLSQGLSQCVTLEYRESSWDTHTDNEEDQSENFQGLFLALESLLDGLSVTQGTEGSLLDETVVVVLSEMGRTPALNSADGRDHWPYTSAMILGPGVTGNRTVGGYNNYFYGLELDFDTCEVDPDGQVLTSANFGGALLALAGLDPVELLPGYAPALGLLSS